MFCFFLKSYFDFSFCASQLPQIVIYNTATECLAICRCCYVLFLVDTHCKLILSLSSLMQFVFIFAELQVIGFRQSLCLVEGDPLGDIMSEKAKRPASHASLLGLSCSWQNDCINLFPLFICWNLGSRERFLRDLCARSTHQACLQEGSCRPGPQASSLPR